MKRREFRFTPDLLRLAGAVVAVAVITAIDFRILHVNSATAGFTYLVLILGLAARMGLRESLTASILSMAAYNFFFLPPVGNFTIADPQNFVALLAFLATAITASRLSDNAKKRTAEARARQQELQRMYDFSRGLIIGKEDYSFADGVVRQIVEFFNVLDAWFYDRASDVISKTSGSESVFEESALRQAAVTGSIWRDSERRLLIIPIRLGGANFGSLGISGSIALSDVGLQAIAQLVAIAIERARVQEASARMEITRQNEQLKSTLLDALAHEFKTPLTSVKAATTTLLSSTLDPSDQKQLVTIVDEEADRMNRLVSDSIDLARIGATPIVLNKEVCAPEEMISSAVDVLRGLFDGRELTVSIDPDLPLVIADRNLTELALRQLLTNAFKYSSANTEVKVRAQRQESAVVISVSDEGAGIPQAERSRIFEKFYRGRDVRSRIPGTGLGLSITREIIESQGGVVLLNTAPGQGATFSITLPISDNSTNYESEDINRR